MNERPFNPMVKNLKEAADSFSRLSLAADISREIAVNPEFERAKGFYPIFDADLVMSAFTSDIDRLFAGKGGIMADLASRLYWPAHSVAFSSLQSMTASQAGGLYSVAPGSLARIRDRLAELDALLSGHSTARRKVERPDTLTEKSGALLGQIRIDLCSLE